MKKDDKVKVLDREFTDAITKLKANVEKYKKKNLIGKQLTPAVVEASVVFLQKEVNKFCKTTKIRNVPKVARLRFPPPEPLMEQCDHCFVGYTADGAIIFAVDGLYNKFVQARFKKKI